MASTLGKLKGTLRKILPLRSSTFEKQHKALLRRIDEQDRLLASMKQAIDFQEGIIMAIEESLLSVRLQTEDSARVSEAILKAIEENDLV